MLLHGTFFIFVGYIASKDRTIANQKFEGMRREDGMASYKFTFAKGLRKATGDIIRDSRPSIRKLKPELP
jgi:hypothetical protein